MINTYESITLSLSLCEREIHQKGGKALTCSPRLPKGGQRRTGGDSRG